MTCVQAEQQRRGQGPLFPSLQALQLEFGACITVLRKLQSVSFLFMKHKRIRWYKFLFNVYPATLLYELRRKLLYHGKVLASSPTTWSYMQGLEAYICDGGNASYCNFPPSLIYYTDLHTATHAMFALFGLSREMRLEKWRRRRHSVQPIKCNNREAFFFRNIWFFRSKMTLPPPQKKLSLSNVNKFCNQFF